MFRKQHAPDAIGGGNRFSDKSKRELEDAPMETRVTLDRNERLIVAETTQDVEPILERNKALRREPQGSDWGRHIATIPNVILVKWLNEEHARGNLTLRLFSKEFDAVIARKLRDPEWRYLRVDR
jgi:hypothetical protein